MRDNGKKHSLFYLLKYQPVEVGILTKERKESSRTSTNKLKIFTIQAEYLFALLKLSPSVSFVPGFLLLFQWL